MNRFRALGSAFARPSGTRPRLVAVVLSAVVALSLVSLGAPAPALADWQRTLTVNFYLFDLYPDGSGRVTSDSGGIDCTLHPGGGVTGSCSEVEVFPNFLTSVDVTLTLTPATGSYACASGNSNCALDGSPKELVVTFTLGGGNITVGPQFFLRSYQVLAGHDERGIVTWSNGGGACAQPSDGCRVFKYGSGVTLTAYPAAGQNFSYWQGAPCEGSRNAVCSFTVTGEKLFYANFGLWKTTADHSGNGQVCVTSRFRICSSTGDPPSTGWLLAGAGATATAVADAGWRFDHWNSGPCAGQGASCTFTLDQDRTIIGTFVKATATPKPTAAASARPSAVPTTRPSANPAASAPAPSSANPSAAPSEAATPQPSDSGLAPASAEPTSTAGEPFASSGPAATGDGPTSVPTEPVGRTGPGGVDLTVLLLVAGAILILAAGFALGRRGRGTSRP